MFIKIKPRKCKFCKVEFEPRTTWQQFDKRECRTAYDKKKRDDLIRRAQRIIEANEAAR